MRPPSTVGQYTGLTDKNGKRIFEGDIVRWGELLGEVKWGEYSQSKCDEYDCTHYGWYFDRMRYGYCIDTGADLNDIECEVIGNIHDNPELVKEEPT